MRGLPDRRVEAAVNVDRALVGVVVERLELAGEVLEGVALLGRDALRGEAHGERLERRAHLAQVARLLRA